MDIEIGGETFHRVPNLLEQIAYRDTWGRGADSFIAMICERLILAQGELQEFEERWTGGFIFENEWQSFRTRFNRGLELKTAEHRDEQPGRYTVAVKVIDIFGNDTMTLVPVNVG